MRHRQLRLLEGEVTRALVPIDQLLNAISDDISRQSNYVSNERRNLITLSLSVRNGELYGQSLAANTITTAPSALRRQPSATALAKINDRRPLVVIRFYRPKVHYEKPLYIVRRALERRLPLRPNQQTPRKSRSIRRHPSAMPKTCSAP